MYVQEVYRDVEGFDFVVQYLGKLTKVRGARLAKHNCTRENRSQLIWWHVRHYKHSEYELHRNMTMYYYVNPLLT